MRSLRLDPAVRGDLEALYADGASALDERRYDDWIELFTEDCEYVLQPRENFDRGLPLATMMLESKGMLRDRIHAIGDTLFHAPYYQRHLVGPLRIVRVAPAQVDVEVNYAVFRTRLHEPTETFNVGRCLDTLVRGSDADSGGDAGHAGDRVRAEADHAHVWRIRSRRVVFDSELVLNSIIYPI